MPKKRGKKRIVKRTGRKQEDIWSELEKALKEYEKYLKKLRKMNPRRPSEFELHAAPLIYLIGRSLQDIRDSINTQSIIIAIGLAALGIEMAVGFIFS